MVGVYRWLPDREAGLIAEMSQDEAFAPARQLALVIAIVGLASAALLAAAIWFVARRVTRPILSLAATAHGSARRPRGAVGSPLDDEVGVLAEAFDEMTAELRSTSRRSSAASRIGPRRSIARSRTLESLVEVSPVAVVTMDTDERVSAWNPAATTLFGYTAKEAIGRKIDDLILRSESLHRTEGHRAHQLTKASAGSRPPDQASACARMAAVIDGEILMVPLVIDGEQLGFYAIYYDITELKAARRRPTPPTRPRARSSRR